uniref:dUTP diphosphatase n=1 Tax=Geotrypetes seraphini TaxID=260995 RepID=A0A6P8SAC0_GEOSA|nr:uncharacterized protein LOC117366983 [Geotrypetes seraphini]
MNQEQLLRFLAEERQKQGENLQAVLKANRDLWDRGQKQAKQQHDELVRVMGEQTKLLTQLLQCSATSTAGGPPGQVVRTDLDLARSGKDASLPYPEESKEQARGDKSRETLRCYRCGKTGHTQRYCRVTRDLVIAQDPGAKVPKEYQIKVSVRGKKITALVDTGAEVSVMSGQLWEELGEGRNAGMRKVPITCIHGEAQEYPLRPLSIKYKGRKIRIAVAVLEAAPYPLILGRDWIALAGTGRSAGIQSPEKWVLGSRVGGSSLASREERQSPRTPKPKSWRPTIRWAPLSEKARAPTRAYPRAAGYDLYAAQEQVVPVRGRTVIKTDIQVSPPPGAYLRVAPRSGLALHHSIDVAAGVIDPDFRGNVAVLLVNNGNSEYRVQMGDRIAQLLCERIWHPDIMQWSRLPETDRGERGFGSTGVGVPESSPQIEALNNPMGDRKATSLAELKAEIHKIKEELASARQDWETGLKSCTEASFQSWKVPIDPEQKRSREQVLTQCQQESEKLTRLMEQVSSQLKVVQGQVKEGQAQQQAVQHSVKEIKNTCGELTNRTGKAESWVVKQQAQEEQLEEHAQHFQKVLATFKGMDQDMNELREQIAQLGKEDLGGITQVVAALAQRVEGLEGPKDHSGGAAGGQREVALLRWPQDFEDPDPPLLSQERRGNKPRKRF